ncbi:hypothetical protein HELRODRAFT_75685, partial [Helobdella robusta]|uniref:ABC transporter domain-containing protein n=1 Tax=Helobdella robusta TaxID=6412 RepID=T1G289_HELRO
YVPQKAWLLNESIRKNILFGLSWDKERYESIINACSLQTDFNTFVNGDSTEIGEKGANLSGGQKQRIALARALYQDADVYLLDDSLSALDPHVSSFVFREAILKQLINRNKTVVFVSHNTNLLNHSHKVVVLSMGRIFYQGRFESCSKEALELYHHLRRSLSKPHESVLSLMSLNSLNMYTQQETNVIDDSYRSSECTTQRSSSLFSWYFNALVDEVTQLMTEEERQIGATPLRFLLQYLKYANISLVVFVVLLYAVKQAVRMAADYYLGLLIEHSYVRYLFDLYLHKTLIYCSISLLSVILIPVSVIVIELLCLSASRNIHNQILLSLSSATMRFFDTTPLGRILNRLSADLHVIDLVMNSHLDCFLFLIMFVLGGILINGCFNPAFLLPILPIIIVAVVVQRFYIASCRELQRLECISKSKILSHFTQVLAGGPVIRTSRQQKRFEIENKELINENNLPLYFYHATHVWVGIRLDLLGALMVLCSCLCALFSCYYGYLDVNSAGFVMLYACTSCFFVQWALKYMSDIEMFGGNVQRLVQYCNLTPEHDCNDPVSVASDWPSRGNVMFQQVSLSYDRSLDPVVTNVDLNIKAGQKVGICGRTGSGKSTLTLGIFRLVEIVEGDILLDDLNSKNIPLDILRSRLSIIPQDPVVFTGSVRFNLDPYHFKSDHELWRVLEVSQLRKLISNLPHQLDTMLTDGGSSLSIGEKQLLCLARALVRNSSILVMDEATASVDKHTDRVIQNIIADQFKDKTVITIAHRISTIMDSDVVVVMSGGQIIEVGNPSELASTQSTNFANFVCDR